MVMHEGFVGMKTFHQTMQAIFLSKLTADLKNPCRVQLCYVLSMK